MTSYPDLEKKACELLKVLAAVNDDPTPTLMAWEDGDPVWWENSNLPFDRALYDALVALSEEVGWLDWKRRAEVG